MTTLVLLDTSATVRLAITYAIVAFSGLAVLLSVIFIGGRVVRPRSVRARLRTGIVAAILVIVLAVLDVYLAFIV
jgi:hypothetical protein